MITERVPHKRRLSTRARGSEDVAIETVSVTCGFCEGRGRDPFGIMSALSTCCVCGGKRTVSVETPYVRCAFCHGTGVYPGSRQTCIACSGVGVTPVPETNKTCPHCLGTGEEPQSEAGFYCLTCHGTGVAGEEEVVYQGSDRG